MLFILRIGNDEYITNYMLFIMTFQLAMNEVKNNEARQRNPVNRTPKIPKQVYPKVLQL